MKHLLIKSIEAGFLIVIGCTAFLSCENTYIGALIFSVALCSICTLNKSLFTGMVAFANSRKDILDLTICVLGNAIGCWIGSILIRLALPDIACSAEALCVAKLSKEPLPVFILGIFCGVMMAIAVHTYRKNSGSAKYIGIFTCVPTFILCGFEHSIADMGYLMLSNNLPAVEMIVFMMLVIAGNAIGGQAIGRLHDI